MGSLYTSVSVVLLLVMPQSKMTDGGQLTRRSKPVSSKLSQANQLLVKEGSALPKRQYSTACDALGYAFDSAFSFGFPPPPFLPPRLDNTLCSQELAQWSSLEPVAGERLPFPVGSVAVRQARQATLRAHQAEQQLAAAVAERDSLARQVEELNPPEMQASESPSGQNLYLLQSYAFAAVCSAVYKTTMSLKDKPSSKTEAVSAGQCGLPHLFGSMCKNWSSRIYGSGFKFSIM